MPIDQAAQRAILKERARQLAQPVHTEREAQATLPVLLFVLEGERFAAEIRYLREVFTIREITPLPGTPPFVLGLINVRGHIMSVVDIRRFLGLNARSQRMPSIALLVANGGMEIGFAVDDVLGSWELPVEHLHPPLPTLSGRSVEYLKGITSERVALLDLDRLLRSAEIIVDESL